MSNVKNISASVHQRLLNKAKESSHPFNEILQRFAIERFLYRLSKSANADKFILKGALMFIVWNGDASRPTMDIDLLGKIENSLDGIKKTIQEACNTAVEEDGITFHADTVTAVTITEDAEYEGVRVRFQGFLGNAKVNLQIDIGFGDVVVPKPQKLLYPVMLDFPAPVLSGYSMETAIAEKFQAMVKRGELNSRMKDFYDICLLSRTFDFSGEVLAKAIEQTFKTRMTALAMDSAIFTDSFRKDESKQVQWRAFVRKSKLTDAPQSFEEAVLDIHHFVKPVMESLCEGKAFYKKWKASGIWH